MNIALDVVERMLPELPVERAITSGYLERDEPRVDGMARGSSGACATAGPRTCSNSRP